MPARNVERWAEQAVRSILGQSFADFELVILDDVVHIGSSNFDIRGLYLNLEMMLRVDDPACAAMMRSYFEQEVAVSLPISADLHRQRSGLLTRLIQAISFFLVTTADYTITRRLNLGRL